MDLIVIIFWYMMTFDEMWDEGIEYSHFLKISHLEKGK